MAESELWDKPVTGSHLPLVFTTTKKLKLISGVCELVPVWWRPHRWVLQGGKQALIDWFFSPCWWHGGIGQKHSITFSIIWFHGLNIPFIANQYYHRHLQAVERALHSNYGVNRRVSCYAGSVIFFVKKCFLSCWDPFNIITRMIFGILGIKD